MPVEQEKSDPRVVIGLLAALLLIVIAQPLIFIGAKEESKTFVVAAYAIIPIAFLLLTTSVWIDSDKKVPLITRITLALLTLASIGPLVWVLKTFPS